MKEIYDQNYFSIDANNVQQGVLEDIVVIFEFELVFYIKIPPGSTPQPQGDCVVLLILQLCLL